jgi:hypothetical protein
MGVGGDTLLSLQKLSGELVNDLKLSSLYISLFFDSEGLQAGERMKSIPNESLELCSIVDAYWLVC